MVALEPTPLDEFAFRQGPAFGFFLFGYMASSLGSSQLTVNDPPRWLLATLGAMSVFRGRREETEGV